MTNNERLKIAIIGSGIAGLGAAVALQKHPGVDVQIYERASELQEIGASIALGPNGMRTLEKLGVNNALSDEVAFRNVSGYPMIYRHWQTNEIISADEHHGDVKEKHRTARFYRPHLQQALLEHIDPSRIHLSKTFVGLEDSRSSDELIISFSDGTKATADLILGADGIQSSVRRFFVPSSTPAWTGLVAFRSVFPVELVSHIPGIEEANHHWGPDRTFFSSRLGRGLFTIVGLHFNDPADPNAPFKDRNWNEPGDVEVLKELYKDWHPDIRAMIAASPYTRLYPNRFASSLESWVHGNGRVTFAGDAAHAHGGAFAAGGSLALDDAYAFALAINHIFPASSSRKPSRSELEGALKLYEKTRKAHTDRVLNLVHEGNKKAIQRLGKSETDGELRERTENRFDPFWIHEHDVEAAFAEVSGLGAEAEQARL